MRTVGRLLGRLLCELGCHTREWEFLRVGSRYFTRGTCCRCPHERYEDEQGNAVL